MKFLLLGFLLWVTGLFHLWDHRRAETDARAVMDGADPASLDWRPVGQEGAYVLLRRAFNPLRREDQWRYAGPVVVFVLWLLVFKSWGLAFFYAGLVMIKWFLSVMAIDVSARRYEARLFGKRLFGETFA